MTVMDRVGGWRFGNGESSQIRARFAACLWISTPKLSFATAKSTWAYSEITEGTQSCVVVVCGSQPQQRLGDLWYDPQIKCNKVINCAIRGSFSFLFERRRKPRACFFRAQCLVMTGAPEREMRRWTLGGRPALLPENEDDGQLIGPKGFLKHLQ